MFTVALVGADGAGKTTVAKRILQQPGLKFRYVYMGANAESSNILLPTTRLAFKLKQSLGKTKATSTLRDDAPEAPVRKKGMKRLLAGLKPYLWLANRLAEEWYRQAVVWSYTLRGSIVVFDRHFFFDYYAYDIARNGAGRPLPRRLHGWMLDRLYPKPDLVIFLDAPASLLFARKPEATLSYLERRQAEYAQFRDKFRNFSVVDASQPEEAVLRDVLQVIEDFRLRRKGSRSGGGETGEMNGEKRIA